LQTFVTKRGLLASTALVTAVAASLAAGSAFAQAGDTADEVAEVVVTGTRIPQPNLESVSAVSVIGSEEVQQTGLTRTEDLINRMPQAFAAQGSMISNGSTGIATVDLRGLGPERTLVLIDGRRLMPGSPGAAASSFRRRLRIVIRRRCTSRS
jgi:outer membrane cobalamin receptor